MHSAIFNLYNQPLLIEANRVEVLVQPIEKCLKLLFWPVPIADGDYNMLCEQAERHRIKLRVDLPRSVRGPVERLAFFRLASIFIGVTFCCIA